MASLLALRACRFVKHHSARLPEVKEASSLFLCYAVQHVKVISYNIIAEFSGGRINFYTQK
jgi:hypothetical protein